MSRNETTIMPLPSYLHTTASVCSPADTFTFAALIVEADMERALPLPCRAQGLVLFQNNKAYTQRSARPARSAARAFPYRSKPSVDGSGALVRSHDQ